MRQTLSSLERHKQDFLELDELLEDLPKKVKQEITVPFGPGAFFLGEIRHTNEVIMHLGDGYFAERTTANARGTVGRFLRQTESNIAVQKDAIDKATKRTEFLRNAKAMSVDPDTGCRKFFLSFFL